MATPRLIFIDTGALLARYIQNDEWHVRSVSGWRELEHANSRCVTTRLVLAEFAELLVRRTPARFAAERLRSLLASRRVELHDVIDEEMLAAISSIERFADQRLGFIDGLSFAVMKRLGIDTAFTFDRHFATAGFTTWPGA